MGLHLSGGLHGYYLGSRQGKEWLGFLRRIGRHVACFFDVNALNMGNIEGIDVMRPSPSASDSSIMLISPARHAEEIILSARELGYRKIVVGNILKFIPRYKELEIDTTFPPFGHFYSLYPDFYEMDERYLEIRSLSRAGDDGINMNDESQQDLLRAMNQLYDSLPAWEIWGGETPRKADIAIAWEIQVSECRTAYCCTL